MTTTPLQSDRDKYQMPDNLGRFGIYGGKYVPETLMPALAELETAYTKYQADPEFQTELNGA
jgi:tryptophan synthase beta chain